jgi:AcrR family transcriptional regulator
VVVIETQRPRALRADARRNRDRLLAAATMAFADEGEDVALETIAARAGVGIGTLYRHFPNRDALIVAAYQHEVDALCAAAADLLATLPADQALRAWVERFADYIETKRAMGNALRSAASDSPLFAQTRERILDAVRLLVDAGAADGTLRADVDPKDMMRVMNGIWYLPAGPDWRDDVGRMLDLVIDGLRSRVSQRSHVAAAVPTMVRLFAGADGQSHFEDVPLEFTSGGDRSESAALVAGSAMLVRRFEADRTNPWHHAPGRYAVFTLCGAVDIAIGDGTVRRLGPGDILIAEDLSGQGHTTREVGPEPRVSVFVPLA